MCKKIYFITILVLIFFTNNVLAQTTEEIPFGNMDTWRVRLIEESFVIGGNTRKIYELAKGDTIRETQAFTNNSSNWATSSVYAKVSGITKASTTVFPEKRGDGYCARLETKIEDVKVFGMINISALATGTIFLGNMIEPIKDTKNPQAKMNTGIPFTKRPKAIVFDYKLKSGGQQIKATGFGKPTELGIPNKAEICLLLQKRWEDSQGNVYAKRVGTGYEQPEEEKLEWVNNYKIPILYGDITNDAAYKNFMRLFDGERTLYCKNSKGKMVPINEVSWADANEQPTHLILWLSSGNAGAFCGAPGSILWIDNVKLEY